jgi:CBS domain-containing protein
MSEIDQMGGNAMGLFGTVVAFGAGYATGMKLGDKPVEMLRETTQQLRERSGNGRVLDIRPVTEVMSSRVETVPGDTTLVEAAKRMAKADIGDVLVVDTNRSLRGIVTDRDIALRVVAEGQDPRNIRAGDVMSPAVSVAPTATVEEATTLMRGRDIRRVPVVDPAGRAIGIVSLGDVSTSGKARAVLADISAAPPNN